MDNAKRNCEMRIQEILNNIEALESSAPYPVELFDKLKKEYMNYGHIMWEHTAGDRAAEKEKLDAEYEADKAEWEAEDAAKNESKGSTMPKTIKEQTDHRGLLKVLVNMWVNGWSDYVEVSTDDNVVSPQEMIDGYLEDGPRGMAVDLVDRYAEELDFDDDDVSKKTGLHIKEIYKIIVPMIKEKMDQTFARLGIAAESKCILKQDIVIEHDGQVTVIPEGTILKEFAMGTGAIAMVPNALSGGSNAPKGGGIAMDKPEKTKVGKKDNKKKSVNESAADARQAIEMLKKDFLSWTGGFKPENMEQIRKYFATSSPIKNKMLVYRTLTDWMEEEEIDEASNSQISPLQQKH